MALVVFLQEDEDVPSVYRNLKIFGETARWPVMQPGTSHLQIEHYTHLELLAEVCLGI